MKQLILSIVFLFLIANLFGQEEKVYQFAGLVFSEETSEPIEFVNIVVNNKKGHITDYIGRFSFLVKQSDTIVFSSIGYKKDTIIINDTSGLPFYTTDIFLERDTIQIDAVKILPWATYEDFKEAVVQLELPDDEYENAQRNIALIKTSIFLELEPNAEVNYRNTMNKYYTENSYKGMYPTISLLNPFAWAKFFEALKKGDFKSKN